MYADYPFYTDTYHGIRLTEENYPIWASRADSWIQYFTMNRCTVPELSEGTQNALKLCECALADACFLSDAADSADPSIQKETVGSHSVTYASVSERRYAATMEIQSIIRRYLANTGLLCRTIPILA